VLCALFKFDVDLAGLDEEIAKADKMVTRLQQMEETRVLQAEVTKTEAHKKTTYIS
jgi:proteasome assembly chaperone (PAC2) family protein